MQEPSNTKIRTLVSLPFHILCHTCELKNCSHEIKPVQTTIDGMKILFHPPFLIGIDTDNNHPHPKYKDFGLGLQGIRNIMPENDVPRLTANRSVVGAIPSNAIWIDFPMNSSEIQVTNVAHKAITALCLNIRSLTKQYWISPNLFSDLNAFGVYTLFYKGPQTKVGIGAKKFLGWPSFITMAPLTMNNYFKAIQDITAIQYDLEETKFLDSMRNFTLDQKENAILDLAISIELAKNKLLDRIWAVEKPGMVHQNDNYKAIKFFGQDIAENVGDQLKASRIKRSFKEEFPNEYDLVRELWGLRNKVGHGSGFYNKLSDGRIKLEESTFKQFVTASDVLKKFCHSIEIT